MNEHVLSQFRVGGGTYYDGRPHTLANLDCTLTDMRLVLRDFRGGTQQFLLADITSIEPHMGLFNKYLDVKLGPSATMRFYGNRDELYGLADKINMAMTSRFA
jgi:hypothetical protein